MGPRDRRVGADSGDRSGVFADFETGAGGGAREGRQVVWAGVPVRVRGGGGAGVFAGVDRCGDAGFRAAGLVGEGESKGKGVGVTALGFAVGWVLHAGTN